MCDVRDALLHDGARLGPGDQVELDPRIAARLEAAGVVARISVAIPASRTPALEGAAGPAGGAIPGTNNRESEPGAVLGASPGTGEGQPERTSIPGEPLPELPDSAYAPDAAPLDVPKLYNINTDSLAELVAAGLSEKLALALDAYRTQHGPFASVDDLVKVNGIGPATLAELRDRLTV